MIAIHTGDGMTVKVPIAKWRKMRRNGWRTALLCVEGACLNSADYGDYCWDHRRVA